MCACFLSARSKVKRAQWLRRPRHDLEGWDHRVPVNEVFTQEAMIDGIRVTKSKGYKEVLRY